MKLKATITNSVLPLGGLTESAPHVTLGPAFPKEQSEHENDGGRNRLAMVRCRDDCLNRMYLLFQ